MEPYVKFRRWFLISLLLTYLLPLPAGLLIWWATTNYSQLTPEQILLVSIFGALLISLLFALAVYVRMARPLERLSNHLSALNRGDANFRTVSQRGNYFGKLYAGLNGVSDKLEEFAEHNQAELAILKTEADRLRNVINSINDGVVALDKDMHIVLFNKAAIRISGYELSEAASQPVNLILPLLHGNSLVLNDWLTNVANSDIQNTSWENLRLKTKDGKTRSVDVEALYQGADPNGIRTLITFHDRTEAQELEDMKVDFVALAAHELRTPISVIRGYLEILEDELKDQLNPEQMDFMRKLGISASQLSGFINNILHVSRIEHGDLSLKLETTDWGKLVTEVVEDLKSKATVQGKKIELNINGDLAKVAVDRLSIVEVLNNLIDNALKYSARDTTVTVSVSQNGNVIETAIRDHGVGIPENAIDKLFTKFYRSHRTRDSHRGTGLGLYMSKSIVEAHGGSIWLQSRVNEGSTFGFMLPVYNEETSPHLQLEKNSKITRGVHGWIKNHSLYRG